MSEWKGTRGELHKRFRRYEVTGHMHQYPDEHNNQDWGLFLVTLMVDNPMAAIASRNAFPSVIVKFSLCSLCTSLLSSSFPDVPNHSHQSIYIALGAALDDLHFNSDDKGGKTTYTERMGRLAAERGLDSCPFLDHVSGNRLKLFDHS